MPTKKELAAIQKLIDDFESSQPQDSNTVADSQIKSTMDAFELADSEAKRKARLARLGK